MSESIDSDAKLAAIFSEIDDPVQSALVRNVSVSGRGRPHKLPILQCNNRLLLQVYVLKYKHGKSWEILTKLLDNLFQDQHLPCNRFRFMVETAVRDVQKLTSEEDRQLFYQTKIDLGYVGPSCSSIGLTRCMLLNFSSIILPIADDKFTNKLVLEIHNFCKKEKVGSDYFFNLLEFLQPNLHRSSSLQLFTKNVTAIKSYFEKLNKSKSRTRDAEDFLNKVFSDSGQMTVSVKTSSSQSTGTSAKKYVSKTTNQFEKIKKLEEDLAVLKELYSCRQKDNAELERIISDHANKTKQQSEQVADLKKELASCKKTQAHNKVEIQRLKSGAAYQKMRRKYLRNTRELTKIKASSSVEKVGTLKTQKRSIQKLLNNQTKMKNKHLEEKKQLKDTLSSLKQQLVNAEAELSLIQSETIVTRSGEKGRPYLDGIEKCVMQLVGECDVSSTKCADVISTVCKWLFNKFVSLDSLPSSTTCISIMDRAQVLAKYQVGETIKRSEQWQQHMDGTSRDHNKIMGIQVNTEGGMLSTGYSGVAVEDSTTLLENAISMMEELAYVFDGESNEDSDTVTTFLRKMIATMSDRSSVQKAFNEKLKDYRSETINDDTDLQFLYCNAHFLLGLATECEKALKELESKLVDNLGHKLGRDSVAKFGRFSNSSESSTARYVRTGCDSLGPRGDEKNGCRQQWDAFCKEKLGKQSTVTNFRMNRFNNFFEGAACLFYHRADIVEFMSGYKDNLNMKLESVYLDALSQEIQAMVRALGIIFYKVTGPFWAMLHSEVEYVDQYIYIQDMLEHFKLWSQDASPLLSSECEPAFAMPLSKETADKKKNRNWRKREAIRKKFSAENLQNQRLYLSLFQDEILPTSNQLTVDALQNIFKAFITCTERQLSDFLPGGKYGKEPTAELRSLMKHCKVTNLVSENEFGDLDFSQFRRRHASLHYHSGLQMVKRNKTISSWLAAKPEDEQESLMKIARMKSTKLRSKHAVAEREILRKTKERLDETYRKKQEKEARLRSNKIKLMDDLTLHNGPCLSPGDVDKVLKLNKSTTVKMACIKNEVRYLKQVLGIQDSRLIFGKKTLETLSADLKSVLAVKTIELPVSTVPPVDMTTPGQATEDGEDDDHEVPSTAMSPAPGKKRKATKKVDNEISNSTSSKRPRLDTNTKYTFTSTGSWVAVAYDNQYFIGEVLKIEKEQSALIQFLHKGYKNIFRWPQVDDFDTVDAKYVFAHDFDVTLSQNGRSWTIPELEYLDSLYDQYKQMYF